MSFFGYLNSPISITPIYDTTPCLEHLMEYEDCVIDTDTDKLQFFMPSWPTMWPGLAEGTINTETETRNTELLIMPSEYPQELSDHRPLTDRQKQLLYECEEERMVSKACFRQLIKLKRNHKHTSWDTAEAANMAFM